MLRASGHSEILKDENKNKNVIDAKRVFDDVTGQEIQTRIRSAQFPDEEIKPE